MPEIKQLNKQLAGAGARMPLCKRSSWNCRLSCRRRLPTICTVRNDEARRTAIHVLKRGQADRKGKQVGPGFPVGIGQHAICRPAALPTAAHRAGPLADRSGPSADGARLRQPRLACAFRHRAGRDAQRFRPQRRRLRAIRNCSTTSPTSSCGTACGSSRCTA